MPPLWMPSHWPKHAQTRALLVNDSVHHLTFVLGSVEVALRVADESIFIQLGKPMPGPVVEFQPHRGNCPNDVDAGNPGLESGGWTVLVIPVKELLDGASEQVRAHIAEIGASWWKEGFMSAPRPDLAPSM